MCGRKRRTVARRAVVEDPTREADLFSASANVRAGHRVVIIRFEVHLGAREALVNHGPKAI